MAAAGEPKVLHSSLQILARDPLVSAAGIITLSRSTVGLATGLTVG